MEEKKLDLELKDIFISYSHKDKDEYVEPLVAALEGAGITCWFDQLEMSPGVSITEKINSGLTNSKLILLCLSENFLSGNWSIKELNAAVGLSALPGGNYRLIPLMFVKPVVIQKAYPVPFADMVYIRWHEDVSETIEEIRKALSQIDETDKVYWLDEASKAYDAEDYAKAAIYSRKSAHYDEAYFPAHVLHVASLLKLSMMDDVWRFLFENEDNWSYMDEEGVDVAVLDYAQDEISRLVIGEEVDDVGFTFAVKDFLSTEHNSDNVWKYLTRIYNKPEFEHHQKSIVKIVAYLARKDALEWIGTVAVKSRESRARKAAAEILYFLASTEIENRPEIVGYAEMLADDNNDSVRNAALYTLYFFGGQRGREKTLSALTDREVMVRYVAFSLLSGKYNEQVDKNWETSSEPTREADPLLTPKIVEEILQEPNELLFPDILDSVIEGQIPAPHDFDADQFIDQRSYSRGARKAKVKILASEDTEGNYAELLGLAINDSDSWVRSNAISALKNSQFPTENSILRKLYDEETDSSARRDARDLVIEKGDSSLSDLYLDIFSDEIADSTFFPSKIFEKILGSEDEDVIKEAFSICVENEQLGEITSSVKTLLELGLDDEASQVVEYCLNNQVELEVSLLAAGRLSHIPDQVLEDFADKWDFNSDEDKRNFISAARSMEFRRSDGKYIGRLNALFQEYLEVLKEGDLQAAWILLSISDAFLEAKGPDKAVPMLETIYAELEKIMEYSFPLRATWERLKILGINKPHEFYDTLEPIVPSSWPDRSGPFYGIGPNG